MSRARGAKAQRRLAQQQSVANTIDFRQAHKPPAKKPPELIPKTPSQERFVLDMLDTKIHAVVAVGPAGTGKTYLAMQGAVRGLRTGQYDRLVLTRPAVGVEDERHGFLPGDIISKMEPWTRPLLDVLRIYYQPREILKLMEDQIVEIAPLAYMRGRTFKDAWIVADEMQNATPAQMKMLLTRIGQGSKILITGDVEQADRPNPHNGLLDLQGRLRSRGVVGMRLVEFSNRDIQRHPLVTQVLDLYRE